MMQKVNSLLTNKIIYDYEKIIYRFNRYAR